MITTGSIVKRVRSESEGFKKEAKHLYYHADWLSRGNLSLLSAALKHMSKTESGDAAAAIAYYAIFSLIPMLILLVILGTSFLQRGNSYNQLMNFIDGILPPGGGMAKENIQAILLIANELDMQLSIQELLQENIRQIIQLRLPVGLAAAAGLIWSSTAVFAILCKNIDRAWKSSKGRRFMQWRLIGFAVAAGMLIGLIILSVLAVSLIGLLSYGLGIFLGDASDPIWSAGLNILYILLPDLMIFITFTFLYCWAPNVRVRCSDAALGALAATVCWEMSKAAFTWYLGSEISNNMLIYGSLGTVILLMLWIYFSGLICLFGAHLTAQIADRRQMEL